MSVQDKSIQYSSQVKPKWWYWSLLVLGSVMVVGGIITVIVLQKGQTDEPMDWICSVDFIPLELDFHVFPGKVCLFMV